MRGGLFWDGTAGNGGVGRIRLSAPQPHCRVHLPQGLQTGWSLLSYCVGLVGPLRILTGEGIVPYGWGRNSALGLGWG